MAKRKRPRPQTVEQVWDLVPAIGCKGLCQESCGPIGMSQTEDDRLLGRGIRIPPVIEALADLDGYRCPALSLAGRCVVYEDRPTVCRLWGVVETMPCPHGCQPARTLSEQEGHRLLALAEQVGGGLAERLFDISDGKE